MAVLSALLLLCVVSRAVLCAPKAAEKWINLGRTPENHVIRVTFAIKQSNVQWLEDKLKMVSYPESPEYGEYLNFDEISKRVRGQPESVQALLSSLRAVGVGPTQVDFTLGQDFAVVKMPAKAAEMLFSTDIYRFRHANDAERVTDTTLGDIALPDALKENVDFVFGIQAFPRSNTVLSRKSSQATEFGVNPRVIARLYNTSGYVAQRSENSQAVASFLQQYYSPQDLELFQKEFKLLPNSVDKVVGYNDPSSPGIEANLDVQYVMGVGLNVSTRFVSTRELANGGQEDFLLWMVNQINTTDSAWVHSVSYGDLEDTADILYMKRLNVEFMKFGVSGRTLLFASGDNGVDCPSFGASFRPLWPASSPYVTAVGGAVSLTRAWEDGGGGFSNAFPAPEYQSDTIAEYLAKGTVPSFKHFNVSGRAYPDVSAFATNFAVFHNGSRIPVDGTSCSTPTFAGLVSLLNDIRLQRGKKTLGFLNPLLYLKLRGRGFFDITAGANGGYAAMCDGFQATMGWDPVSGWGSPNFGVLKDSI